MHNGHRLFELNLSTAVIREVPHSEWKDKPKEFCLYEFALNGRNAEKHFGKILKNLKQKA